MQLSALTLTIDLKSWPPADRSINIQDFLPKVAVTFAWLSHFLSECNCLDSVRMTQRTSCDFDSGVIR
jgi:hypothetical protein